VLYKADDIAGEKSAGIIGRMSPERAMDILLRGTNLSAKRYGSATIALVRRTRPPPTPKRRQTRPVPALKAPVVRPCRSPEAASSCLALPEITVTGEKLESSLQQATASIAVLGNEELQGYNMRSLKDLGSGNVPALRIVPYLGRSSALTVGMRGLVPTDATQITRDPTVGVYLNGVYLGRVQGLGAYSLDVERVEILRGPQGTMFGRNSIGGAINIITRKPAGAFALDAQVGASSFSGRDASLRIDLPKQHDISASFSVSIDRNDGWVENPLSGQANWHRTDRKAMRASLLWQPAPNSEVQYDWDKSIDGGTAGYSALVTLDAADMPIAPAFGVEGQRVRRARGGFVLNPSEGHVTGHSLRGSHAVSDWLTINAVASWRSLDQDQWDQSAGIFDGFVPGGESGRLSYANVVQHQFNGEISASGQSGDVRYLLGLFDFRETGRDRAVVANTVIFDQSGQSYSRIPGIDLKTAVPNRSSEVDTRSRALFGRLAWTPSFAARRITFDAGLRYTAETKRGSPVNRNGAPVEGGDPALPVIYATHRVDPALSLAFDIDDHNRVYLKWSRAFRAGGANTRSPTFRAYDAEQVATWELGYKSHLLDQALTLNMAAFASTLQNPQIDVGSFANISQSETVNGKRPIVIHGVEADARLLAFGGLIIDANLAYTKFRDGVQDIFVDDVRNRIPITVAYAPRFAANLSLTRDFPIGRTLRAQAHVYGSIRGRERAGVTGDLISRASDVGARLEVSGLRWRGADLKLGFWAKNLLNESHEVWTYRNQWPTAYDLRIFNDPRSMGVTLNARM
jgi:iron complex outermembrane receptor protein